MHVLTVVGLIALLAGPVEARQTTSERVQARLDKTLAGRVAGKPVDCINLRDIRSSEIIARTAIVYRTSANKVFVNYPTSGASFLDDDDILVTRTSLSRLCSIDIVQLVDRTSRFSSGSIGLGKFIPYLRPPGK